MACSLVFLRINELLNLWRKSAQVPKPGGGVLMKAFSVSVRAQRPANPSFMKERANVIFLSSWS